ncbi:hypothetical protein [Glaciimonas immobilis]|uniref:Uncharacterized protein n=1 Tax=Glaciimonas immobilis TaxID=728004 RepID=A0A840RW93_9BURK|nr:hypothetical protein [Glaciimonas immobilis]KAF3998594.1 hypothetical protein HAV38_06995 [Glaciimonas immobilis]MBB5201452.1 hypothetical protein [Glaciimonas immobilis]
MLNILLVTERDDAINNKEEKKFEDSIVVIDAAQNTKGTPGGAILEGAYFVRSFA